MPKRILLVDDDQGISNSLAVLLRGEGYDVDVTTDSTEGAVFIKENRYDISIFDYKMKGLNGVDLLKMTKVRNPQCSVFIISGMLDIDELSNKKKDADFVTGIITKPFDVESLLQRIAAVA